MEGGNLNCKQYTDIVNILKSGKGYTDVSLSSWSMCYGVAKNFSQWNNRNIYSLVLKLESTKRIGILGMISANPDEFEFILKRGTALRFIKYITHDKINNNYEILVEELND